MSLEHSLECLREASPSLHSKTAQAPSTPDATALKDAKVTHEKDKCKKKSASTSTVTQAHTRTHAHTHTHAHACTHTHTRMHTRMHTQKKPTPWGCQEGRDSWKETVWLKGCVDLHACCESASPPAQATAHKQSQANKATHTHTHTYTHIHTQQ